MNGQSLTWAGDVWSLYPPGVLFLANQRTLVLADVHLGKAASFRRRGVPVPAGTTHQTLERITTLLHTTNAERLIVLGDFLHHREGCEPTRDGQASDVVRSLARWRGRHARLEVDVILGNHDRQAQTRHLLREFDFAFHDSALDEPPLRFVHHPSKTDDRFTLAGHVHPAVHLHGPGRQRIKTPCLLVQPRLSVLPAFGSFTGTHPIRPRPADRLFAVNPDQVIEIPQRTNPTQHQPTAPPRESSTVR